MTDQIYELNNLLKKYNAPPTSSHPINLQRVDHFIDEAYKLNARIKEVITFLKDIRHSYLSKDVPPRRLQDSLIKRRGKYLTERDKENVDANTKQILRELDAGIRILAEAEDFRRKTEVIVLQRKYKKSGLGALGTWASGGNAQEKSKEEELEEAMINTFSSHRENVLVYLRQRLQKCASQQASMMEKRIVRDMEKNHSLLGQARLDQVIKPSGKGFEITSNTHDQTSITSLESQESELTDGLTPEKLQVFEKENQYMLRHYESTLNQVRNAQKSLLEISELQNQLVQNLSTQSAHIDQLASDSYIMAGNVSGGNQHLKKASQRKSTAKYVFYASFGLSISLIVWDFFI